MGPKTDLNRVLYQMIALSLLVFFLFGSILFFYFLPKIETALISQKKNMLKSITQIAVSFLENQYQAATAGQISIETAKQNAIDSLRCYRYGEENKDYFWINDGHPKMIMHPYRRDLEGYDLSAYTDPEGSLLFQESVKITRRSGEGYISYQWQAKDDAERVIPKLSYVREFKPWGWIIGTGIYMEDIKIELDAIYRQIIVVSAVILSLIAFLQFLLIKRFRQILNNKIEIEKALKENEEKYRSMVENIQIGIARTTPGEKGRHIELNSGLAAILGYTKEELKEIPISTLYTEESKREEFIKKITQFNMVKHEELTLCRKDGKQINVSATGWATRDEKGNIKYFDLILEDITEEKMNREEFLKDEKLKSIGILAGGIAHDFNNILTGLYGNMTLAKLELSSEDEAYQLLLEAELSMTKATELTHQLLTFSKGGDPIKEIIILEPLIRETAQFSLSGSNIRLVTDINPQLGNIFADKFQISQVISNLVMNARQAMPDGGALKISAKNIELKENEIKLLPEGNYIKISVEDEGTGIAEHHILQIFDPYFSTRKTGNGMGLATSYSIIRKHNGCITVLSTPGKGTSFFIFLPVQKKEDMVPIFMETESMSHTGMKSANILIMDDDEQVCAITRKMIQRFGFTASIVPDGKKAVSMVEKAIKNRTPFDLILMDLTIPGGMGGKDAIREILKIDPDTKAIVISGYSNDPVLSNYNDYGFKGMLCKPFTITELREILDKVLK